MGRLQYNLPEIELRKACKKLKVPMPQNGHWSKVKVGRGGPKEEIGLDYKGQQEISIDRQKEDVKTKAINKPAIKPKMVDNQKESAIKRVLAAPHKLVVQTREILKGKSYRDSRYTEIVSPSFDGGLDIRVSHACLDRALALMDTLIKELYSRGYAVEIRSRETFVIYMGERIQIMLRERQKMVPATEKWKTTDYIPTGSFYLKVSRYPEVEFRDGKVPLEDQMSKIIEKIELKARERRDRTIEHEKWQAEQREKEHLARIYEQKQEKELADFRKLFHDSDRWHKASILRNYVDEVEAKAAANGRLSQELNEWLTWARKKIDWYDPFVNLEDELFEKVDKESLTLKKNNILRW